MSVCVYCGYENIRAGTYFCENCAKKLAETDPGTARDDDNFQYAIDNVKRQPASYGDTIFTDINRLTIYIRNEPDPLIVDPVRPMVIGRVDRNNLERPDIDLTRYHALEYGVSRLHAKIQRTRDGLTITDIGSSNGIFLNGRRLLMGKAYPLCHGDEVILGRLVTNVYFD
jgi:pSer/pThr/pTyr-binding forkhead associated (FHA) protein